MITSTVLIGYDGSADARSAIEAAAAFVPGATAVVLYARQPLESVAAHLEGHAAFEDLRGLDASTLDASERIAEEGAAFAREKGLTAESRVASTMSTASEAIVATAEQLDVGLIVLGTRGRRGLRATLLGSTSTDVLHNTTRPTLIIPSPGVADARRSNSMSD